MLLSSFSQTFGFRFITYFLIHTMLVWGVVAPVQAAAPLANAGPDRVLEQSHLGGRTLQLDGSGSFDPDGDPLNYQWFGPFGNARGSTPVVTVPTGAHRVSLVVDDGNETASDTALITIEPCFAVAARAKRDKVQLTWPAQTDAVRYDVYRASSAAPAQLAKVATTTPDLPLYLDAPLPSEVTYLYTVATVTSQGACFSAVTASHPTTRRGAINHPPVIFTAALTESAASLPYSYDVGAADPNLDVLSYSLISFPAGMTIDAVTGLIEWLPPAAGAVDVEVAVNDGRGLSATQRFTINVQDVAIGNARPVANAGADQSVSVTATVQLDGGGSTDPDGDPLTYAWSLIERPTGSSAALSSTTAVMPTFVADRPGSYRAQLIVNDGQFDSAPDTVTITTENSPPVANAGAAQSGFVTDAIILDGTGSSDVDGDALTFAWSFLTRPAGSTAAFDDPTQAKPRFLIDVFGDYVAQLIVNDGALDSAPTTVTITTLNSAPVANAGPDQAGFVGDTITLDGSASSDVDGDLLGFRWSLISVPAGSGAALDDDTAVKPSFVIDVFGEYVAQLIVNDGTIDSAPDTVKVISLNSAPVADAGPDQRGALGATITLDGTGSSDVDGDALTYDWSFTSRPAGSRAAFDDATSATPSFTIDVSGDYVAQLIVNDGKVDSAPATVTVSTENTKPVADAGPDQTVDVGATVTLDGTGSRDADNDPLTFAWSFTARPAGSGATLDDPGAEQPSLPADRPGLYVVQLLVNDGTENSAPDTVSIEALALVPDVVGDPQSDAEAAILAAGLAVGTFTTANSDTIPAGSVISQDPAAGSSVAAGTSVNLVVSLGPALVSVPDVVGQPQAAAEATIKAAGLNVGIVTSANNDTVPAGNVISQDPVSGTNVAAGTAVNLVVSVGPALIQVPNVVGQPQADAEVAITGVGLVVGTVTTANSDTVPAGNVISQTPVGGTNVTAGTAVNLVVSLGAALVSVPNVVDQPQAVAEAAIVAAGLTVGTVTTASSATVPAGSVISQDPVSGTSVAAGTPVNLVVSLGAGVPDTEPPSLDVALDRDPPIYDQGNPVILTITAGDNVGTPTLAGELDGTNLSISVGDNPIDTSGFGLGSTHTIRIEATDAAGNQTIRTILFTIRDPADGTPPTVSITSPAADAQIITPTQVLGTVTDPDGNLAFYEVQIAPKDTDAYTTVASGTSPVVSGALGLLDTTLIESGMYDLRLRAEDANGNAATTPPRTLLVQGGSQSANVSVTFTDLSVPVAGIPITVNRTYDSRQRGQQGDFGFGWSLSVVQSGRYSNNREPGDGWQILKGGGIFGLPCQTVSETKTHITEIRFSDTEFYRFKLRLTSPAATTGGCFAVASFTQIGGVPGASLQILDDTDVFYQNASNEVVHVFGDRAFEVYEPQNVELTRLDGTKFRLTINAGLNRIADTNGNAISISATGVSHSSGKGITFTRDSEGRISSITDPSGERLTYTYSTAGDLTAVTDRTGNTTSFVYNFGHFLRDIIDPTGRVPQRNVYDEDGRLIAYIDADGNRIAIDTDAAANTTQLTSKTGVATSLLYNAQGQVVEASEGGATVQATYDARGNKLSQTDALGNTTTYTYDANNNLLTWRDPLGNTLTRTYNARGQVLTETDRNGRTTTRTYGATGNLLTVTNPAGATWSYTYDSRGNRLTETDPLGNTTSSTYDGFGNLISRTDPLGNTTTYAYDANGNRLTQTDALGNTTTYAYDANGNRVRQTDPLGNVRSWAYDGNNRVVAETDANGNTIATQYDARGNEVRRDYPDGSFELFLYDADDRRTAVTDRGLRTRFFEYDSQGRLLEILFPDGAQVQQQYDAAGRLTATIDPRGNRTEHESDAAGRRTLTRDPLGNVTLFAFDANGNQTGITDANGHTTQYDYDGAGRLIRTRFPDGNQKAVSYDPKGQKISETDESGQTTSYEYDPLGRLIKVTDVLGGETLYGYDAVGNRISQTDANGNTTLFEYDALGRLTRTTLPLAMSETRVYDAVGNLVSITDFNGKTTTFAYDVNNRLVERRLPEGNVELTTYTPTGQRATVTDARGVTSFEYDVRDRLTRRIDPDGSRLEYTYDLAGNRTLLRTPAGDTAFAFDALNRLITVTDPDGGISAYTYDAAGNRATVTSANDTSTSHTYDQRNRLTTLETRDNGGALIASHVYTLGASGNRTRVVEGSGRTVDYSYDQLYRLTTETIVDPALGNRTVNYTYDPVGNRTTKSVSGAVTAYTYDANDRLLSEGSNTFAYDANGNQISETGKTYQYDSRNRLVRVESGGTVTEYDYDMDGFRVSSTVNGASIINFLVDHNRQPPQVIRETDGTGAELVSYVYGDDLLSQKRNGVASHFHTDGQMSIRQITSPSGSVTDTYTYDAFGVLLGSTGTTINRHRYTGQYQDANSGYYYLRARWLNPSLGIFTSTDPIAGNVFEPLTLHRYQYAQNNPVNRADPTGRFSLASVMTAVSISQILVTIAPTVTTGIATAALIKVFWEPGFEMRYGGIELVATGGPDAIIALGLQLYQTGNVFIEIGAALIEFTNALIDASFAFTGLAGSVNSLATSANALAGAANLALLLNDINGLVGKIGSLQSSLNSLQTLLTGTPPNSSPPPAAQGEANSITDVVKEIVVLGLKIAAAIEL